MSNIYDVGAAQARPDVIRRQRWEVARARALHLLERFDPNQPRDEDGKWSADGGAGVGSSDAPTAFVSPNISNLTFGQAVAALDSKAQANLRQASDFIDGRLGISGESHPAIGAWADGAENSMMFSAPGATTEQMRAASAMKGWLADQKSVLIFDPTPNGDAFMAHFDVAGKSEDVHAKLLNDGLAFHTLQPMGGDAIRVHVYGSDQGTIDAIDKAARDANAQVRITPGRGEFLGTAKDTGSDREQRDDARRVYEEAIRQISSAGTLAGRDVGKVWDEARDYWQSLSATKGLKFDPDQPRDEGGKWTSGGGGGGGGSETTGTTAAPAASIPRLTRPALQTHIDSVAFFTGYDANNIAISTESLPFMLNGQEYMAAGVFTRGTSGVPPIKMFINELRADLPVDGIIHHEVMHAKFENAFDQYVAESMAVESEDRPAGTPASRDPVMAADGSLKPPYDAKYPAYTAMHEAFYRHDPFTTGAFSDADGVSDYSYEYWKQWRDNGKRSADFNSAVNETLAEMARIRTDLGTWPDHMGERIMSWRGEGVPKPPQSVIDANNKRWRDLYDAVDKVSRL